MLRGVDEGLGLVSPKIAFSVPFQKKEILI
jgi:hypothetical protein